jgi:hypothetical protein
VVERFPLPDGAPQLDAPLDEHVQVTPVIAAGTVSVTGAAVAVDGPALVMVIV